MPAELEFLAPDPRWLGYLRVVYLVNVGVLCFALAAVGSPAWIADPESPLSIGTALGVGSGLLLGIFAVLFLAPRRLATTSYCLGSDRVVLRYGVWWRQETVVPRSRIQHTDVVHGPLQRAFGLASLVIHTAGTQKAMVTLPGLTKDTADALRDRLQAALSDA